MEHIKIFLDTSTVHGLSWISNTTRWSRLFWIVTVIAGFTGAILLIHASFYNWEKRPVSTTIETLPISEVTFPNVTLCPPRNSLLDLNYDIMLAVNITLDNKTRKYLLDCMKDWNLDLQTNYYFSAQESSKMINVSN